MDLDLGTIVVGIVCAAICVIPFILMGKGKKKKEQEKLLSLTNIANKHEGRITHHEFCGNFGIAIDGKKNFIFFHKEVNGEITEGFVDLNQTDECKVNNVRVSLKRNHETYDTIDRLDLCFKPSNKNSKETKWELFSRENNNQLCGEFQVAERWNKLINDQIHITVW